MHSYASHVGISRIPGLTELQYQENRSMSSTFRKERSGSLSLPLIHTCSATLEAPRGLPQWRLFAFYTCQTTLQTTSLLCRIRSSSLFTIVGTGSHRYFFRKPIFITIFSVSCYMIPKIKGLCL